MPAAADADFDAFATCLPLRAMRYCLRLCWLMLICRQRYDAAMLIMPHSADAITRAMLPPAAMPATRMLLPLLLCLIADIVDDDALPEARLSSSCLRRACLPRCAASYVAAL